MSINSLVLLSESLARIISKVASAESIYQLNYTYQIQAAWSSPNYFLVSILGTPILLPIYDIKGGYVGADTSFS